MSLYKFWMPAEDHHIFCDVALTHPNPLLVIIILNYGNTRGLRASRRSSGVVFYKSKFRTHNYLSMSNPTLNPERGQRDVLFIGLRSAPG
jgi:hypothetical protein